MHILRFGPPGQAPQLETCAEDDPYFPNAVGDAFAFRTTGGGKYPAELRKYAPPQSLVRWPLCDYARQTLAPAAASGGVLPLNEDTVAIVGFDSEARNLVAIQSTDGKTQHVLRMTKGDAPDNALTSSEDGSRFAVSISTWRGGVEWLDIGGHIAARRIAVYDSATGRQVAAIPVSPKTLPDIAMSPDGHILAILQGHELTVASI